MKAYCVKVIYKALSLLEGERGSSNQVDRLPVDFQMQESCMERS